MTIEQQFQKLITSLPRHQFEDWKFVTIVFQPCKFLSLGSWNVFFLFFPLHRVLPQSSHPVTIETLRRTHFIDESGVGISIFLSFNLCLLSWWMNWSARPLWFDLQQSKWVAVVAPLITWFWKLLGWFVGAYNESLRYFRLFWEHFLSFESLVCVYCHYFYPACWHAADLHTPHLVSQVRWKYVEFDVVFV